MSRPSPQILLFAFLLALYATTSAGHTSSNDEDEMFYVTQGIVERGSLALPPDEARALAIPRGAAIGPDGKYYSPYGVLQPALGVPLYLVGRVVAGAFDPAYRDFITHAAVTLVSAFATAATALVLVYLALELGASQDASLLLGVLFGLTTIAWPYARYFWSEPVAALCLLGATWLAVRGNRHHAWRDWLFASWALGLAVIARPSIAAALPAFLVYLALNRDKRGSLAFGAGLVAPAVALGLYNLVRFGLVLETGQGFSRGLDAVRPILDGGNFATGLYGLLLSPGKSVLLYSPPLLIATLGVPSLARRWPRESVLLAGVVLSQIVLVAPLVFWHGDAAWGPRYLVPITALLLLPLVGWLDSSRRPAWQRWLFRTMAGLGLAVQLLAVSTNYDTYIYQTGGVSGTGANDRWFSPAVSPILGAARQLVERLTVYGHGIEPGAYALGEGLYVSDSPTQTFPRWTNGDAQIRLAPRAATAVRLELTAMERLTPGEKPAPGIDLAVLVDGVAVLFDHWHTEPVGASEYHFTIDLGPLTPGEHVLGLRSAVFVPSSVEPGSTDGRALGLQLTSLGFADTLGPLRAVASSRVSPLPVTAEQPWSRTAFGWFYAPAQPHLTDLWAWYVAVSGLPSTLGLLVILPLLTTMWLARRLTLRSSRDSLATCLIAVAVVCCGIGALGSALAGIAAVQDRRPPALQERALDSCNARCQAIVTAYRQVLGRDPDREAWAAYYWSPLDESAVRGAVCASGEARGRSTC